MKRILYIIGVVLLIASCTKTDEIAEPTLGDGYVTLSAGSPSRVSGDGLEWTGGEEICVVTVKDSKYSYLKYTISNAGTGAMTPYSDSDKIINDGEFTYYAYYPYGDGVQQYKCDLTQSQEPLLAVVGTKSSSEKVSLQFSHKYAHLTFNLVAGAVQDLSDATVKVSGAYVKGDYRSTDGTFSNVTKEDLQLTTTNGVATTYIIPTNLWHSIDVVVTAGGSEYATKLESRRWESGKTYSFDIEVGKTSDI